MGPLVGRFFDSRGFVNLSHWQQCLEQLQDELSAKQFNTWIRPIQAETEEGKLILLVPNSFVLEHVEKNFQQKITDILANLGCDGSKLHLVVGTLYNKIETINKVTNQKNVPTKPATSISYLNPAFTFENFIEGKSNQLARAAALQVSQNSVKAYNPLFIYGGVGLGKTHLMHAIGNMLLKQKPQASILYLHSERFVADMVKALQRNSINEFKKFYRSLDALLIDDIQFFAGKDRSQEEFFHTFNALLDAEQQIVLTCDRYPKELSGLEERLKSRFGWGLTVAIEPPELETRVAILMNKAECSNIKIPEDVAFFIAKHIQSNVRELEGALKRVIANSHFTGQPITLSFTKEALKDLLTLQAKLVTIANIQKTVAEYYKIKISDLLSKRRNRAIARPRQIAMTLAKELTNHSLPEIADTFGGRDHTTVIHANRTIKDLIASNLNLAEDYRNLIRILST